MTLATTQPSFAPRQSWKWVRRLMPKRMQPFARGMRKRLKRISMQLEEPYYTIYPFTQVHPIRQQNMVRLADIIEKERIEGAIVECGVLDGGMAALMAWATRASAFPRPVHLFDAWQGLPPTTAQDGVASRQWEGEVVGSPARVRAVMAKLKIDPSRLNFHKGWFHEVFPNVAIDKIALLHIDPDFYEPVKICLDKWYPHVSPGGFVQIDDYAAFSGCRQAIDEFLAAHPDVKLETFGEFAKAFYFRKPTA